MASGFGHRTPLGRCYPVYMVRAWACEIYLGGRPHRRLAHYVDERPNTPRPTAAAPGASECGARTER